VAWAETGQVSIEGPRDEAIQILLERTVTVSLNSRLRPSWLPATIARVRTNDVTFMMFPCQAVDMRSLRRSTIDDVATVFGGFPDL
jgi:hypothetical protein